MERQAGLASYVNDSRLLTEMYRYFRDWEAELGQVDSTWENRLCFEEWSDDQLTETQLEMVYKTVLRKLLTVLIHRDFIGMSIREAEKLDDAPETRAAVGRIIDGLIDLAGAERRDDNNQLITAKVNHSDPYRGL